MKHNCKYNLCTIIFLCVCFVIVVLSGFETPSLCRLGKKYQTKAVLLMC